jgi:Icc-related predicted phosphoesterase
MGLFSKQEKRTSRLLFITDLHASEITFRKLMNAVEVYEATVLIIGGDLAGKRVVPVVHGADGYKTSVSGEDILVNESGLPDVVAKIKNRAERRRVPGARQQPRRGAPPIPGRGA